MNRLIMALIVGGCVALAAYLLYPREMHHGAPGAALASVTVPALSGAALEGEAAFNGNCASCHGKDAAGKEGIAPPLVHVIYEPGHHSDRAFVLAAKQGVRQHHWRFGNMPPVAGVTDQQISDIITYIRTLQRANGIQ